MFSWIPSLEPSASDVDGWDEEGTGAAESVEVVDSDEDAESNADAEVLVAEDAVPDALGVSSESEPDSDERAVLDTSAEAEPESEIEAVAEAESADPVETVEFAGSTA